MVFALCAYSLGVLLQVEGWKMDECPSWGYNKTRKQQLCDGEYSFSPSCSQLVSTIALIAYHSQADESAGMTTAQRAAVLRNHRQRSSATAHNSCPVCLLVFRPICCYCRAASRTAWPTSRRPNWTGKQAFLLLGVSHCCQSKAKILWGGPGCCKGLVGPNIAYSKAQLATKIRGLQLICIS